jgi:hypothetical protein
MKAKYKDWAVLLASALLVMEAALAESDRSVGFEVSGAKTNLRLKRGADAADPTLKGRVYYRERLKGAIKTLELNVQAGFGPGRTFIDLEEARDSYLDAYINGAECYLDFESRVPGRKVEFKLKLREKNAELMAQAGDCLVDQMPTLNGPITVEYDQDGDTDTPNLVLLEKR